ncbi:MAG: cytochrome c class [Gemmatimonadetes bacterium]|nr:cytochrome c class [Gemmatimonadota bacterium]
MRRWLRRLGYAAGGLFGLVLVAAIAVYAASELRIRRTYGIAGQKLALRSDPATLARGKHLATSIGKCVDCHGADLGGKAFIDAPPIGVVFASNLTAGRGGALARYTDTQLEAAIRHGVRYDHRPLKAMPSDEFYNLSDGDVAAIIGYLRTVPPVDREIPAARVGPIGRLLYLKGDLPLLPAEAMDHARPRTVPPQAPTREYGRYLSSVSGCSGCHGEHLSGGPIPGVPPEWPAARNLTPNPVTGIGGWTEADFVRALRTGTRPDGTRINEVMPWKLAGQMTDDEMHAIWLYLRSVPARPFGGR